MRKKSQINSLYASYTRDVLCIQSDVIWVGYISSARSVWKQKGPLLFLNQDIIGYSFVNKIPTGMTINTKL